jgi:hypothetical protein
MALPFKNSIAATMAGYGAGRCKGSVTQTFTTTGSVTMTIGNTTTTPSAGGTPFFPSGGPAPSGGIWRFRVTNMTTTATVAVVVNATDGTNTWIIGTIPANAAGAGYIDIVGDFQTDILITAISFAVTVGGTATSVPCDAEVCMT